jgi:hypothetical protein
MELISQKDGKRQRQEILALKKKSENGVTLDMDAIKVAKRILGIKKPIRIRWSSGKYTNGSHGWDSEINAHTIALSTNKDDAIQMSECLWHELTHARQAEQCGNPAMFYSRRFYKKYGYTGKSYWNNPYEVEARNVAADNRDNMLCH